MLPLLLLPPSTEPATEMKIEIVALLVNYLPSSSSSTTKGGGAVLFRLARGRVPVVRVSSSSSTDATPTLKSFVSSAKASSSNAPRLRRVEAAWRRTMGALGGKAGAAFRRAWAWAAAASWVCTAPGCGGFCVSEEEGGLAALRAHVAAAHPVGTWGSV